MRQLLKFFKSLLARRDGEEGSLNSLPAVEQRALPQVPGFGFNDLHSFKDYVVFVGMCAPDQFPEREWDPEPWTLDRAFKGLTLGLDLSVLEKGHRPQFQRVRQLFDEAFKHYRMGDRVSGFRSIEEARKLLREIPSQ